MQRLIIKHLIEPMQKMRRSQFRELPLRGGEVVFLGDSITAGGVWHEWFPNAPVVNRGIDGDTSAGVLARLEDLVSPSKVFLLIGTNDIQMSVRHEQTVANVTEIVKQIKAATPATQLVVQSIMPRKKKFRSRVEALNVEYRRLADEVGATYLDLWPALADGDGALRSDYTLDNLHLNGAGYRAWTTDIRPLVSP